MASEALYDGINSLAAGIHKSFPNAAYVAGYVDGTYAWSTAEWDLFPNAKKIQIAVTASYNGGDVLDVENGDATAAQTAGWIKLRKAAGYDRPTIYTSLSNVAAVREGTGSYVLGTDYDLWVADYDGSTSNPYPGCVAKQYKSTAGYDLNVVYDTNWPYRSATPGTFNPPGAGKCVPSETSAELSWSGPSGATQWHVQVYTGDSLTGKNVFDKVVSTTSVNATGLAAGTKYGWRVSVNGPTGKWSGLMSFTTGAALALPTNFKYSETATSVTASWTAASGATAYDCQLMSSDEKTQAGRQSISGTSVTFTGLSPSMEYKFRILSEASGKTSSPWSGYATVTTPADPNTYPAPTNLKATGWLGYEISWSAVSLNGVAAPSYTVQVMDVNNKQFSEQTVTGTSAMLRVAAGTYTANVWGNSAPVGPPHSSIKFTV